MMKNETTTGDELDDAPDVKKRLSVFWLLNFEWKLNNPSITPEQVLAMDIETVVKGVTPKQEFYNLEELNKLEVVPFRERGNTVIKFQFKEV